MSVFRLKAGSPDYPQRLGRLHDPPARLFVQGSLPDWNRPVLAVVGSRKASAYGRWAVEKLVGPVAAAGVHIISGLALGIDGLAHQAALGAGGKTSAVLPSGLDEVYPASHRSLARRITESGGALVSEYPPGTRAAAYHFPARNRIVAALSDAVLVIEAGPKSGTLITAGHALDLGLPVLAVPGAVNWPGSFGTNQLIKTGAGLVASAEDILAELGLRAESAGRPRGANAAEQAIIDYLADHPFCSAGQLAEALKLSPAEAGRRLIELELKGAVKAEAGGWALA